MPTNKKNELSQKIRSVSELISSVLDRPATGTETADVTAYIEGLASKNTLTLVQPATVAVKNSNPKAKVKPKKKYTYQKNHKNWSSDEAKAFVERCLDGGIHTFKVDKLSAVYLNRGQFTTRLRQIARVRGFSNVNINFAKSEAIGETVTIEAVK